MLFSLVVLGLSLVTLFLIPLRYIILFLVYVYGVLVWYDFYKGRINLLNVSILGVYVVIGIFYYFVGWEDILPFTGSFVYGALFFASFLGVILRKPFTLPSRIDKSSSNEMDKISLKYHLILNVFLGTFFLISLVFSIVLFPRPSYIWIPIVICVVGSIFSIYIGKLLVKLTNALDSLRIYYGGISKIFSIWSESILLRVGRFTVKQIEENDREILNDVLRKGYVSVYMKSQLKASISYDEFIKSLREEDEILRRNSLFFVCLDETSNNPVGSVRVTFSDRYEYVGSLGLEKCLGISLENFRKKGYRISEIGRLVILIEGIEKGKLFEVMIGLVVFPLLVLKGVDIVFVDALDETKGFYEKMGFRFFNTVFHDREIGQNTWIGYISTRDLIKSSKKRAHDKLSLVEFLEIVYFANVLKRKLKKRLEGSIAKLSDKDFVDSLVNFEGG